MLGPQGLSFAVFLCLLYVASALTRGDFINGNKYYFAKRFNNNKPIPAFTQWKSNKFCTDGPLVGSLVQIDTLQMARQILKKISEMDDRWVDYLPFYVLNQTRETPGTKLGVDDDKKYIYNPKSQNNRCVTLSLNMQEKPVLMTANCQDELALILCEYAERWTTSPGDFTYERKYYFAEGYSILNNPLATSNEDKSIRTCHKQNGALLRIDGPRTANKILRKISDMNEGWLDSLPFFVYGNTKENPGTILGKDEDRKYLYQVRNNNNNNCVTMSKNSQGKAILIATDCGDEQALIVCNYTLPWQMSHVEFRPTWQQQLAGQL